MRRLLWMLLVLLVSAPAGAWGATYYVRALGGSYGAEDGSSYANAFDGFVDAAATVTWAAGDTLYICGAHTETLLPASGTTGTPSNPIKFNFNCPSDPGSIRKSVIMSEGLTGGNWTDEGGNLWYLSLNGYAATYRNPRRVWLSGTEEFPAILKTDLGTHLGGAQYPLSRWWYDSGNERLYLYATANPATLYSSFESLVATSGASCGYTAMCFPAATRAYIDVIDPVIEGGNFSAIVFIGAPTGIHIYGTTQATCQIGGRSPVGILFLDASSNGTGVMPNANTVSNCTIDPAIPSHLRLYGTSSFDFGGWGNGIYFRYGGTNNIIENNRIANWTHANIDVSGTLGTNNITGQIFRDNVLDCDDGTGVYLSYCRAISHDGTADGQATGNSFLRNTIQNATVRTQFNGNGNYFIGNIIKDQQCEIISGGNRCESLDIEGYVTTVSHDNYIANNLFLNNIYGPCISFKQGTNVKSNIVIANNVLVNCGGTAIAGKENIALYIQNHANVGNQLFYNNAIYDSAVTNTVYYKATGATTVAGFQAACSGDICSGNIASDPLLLSTTDFRTQGTSPLRRAGRSGYPCSDVRGRACYPDRPDIGAYQATSGDPANTRAAR